MALHLRARNVPAFALGAAVVALIAWAAADWLSSRPNLDGAISRLMVVATAPALAAAILSSTLGAADEELERSTARPWRPIRAVHVVVLTALAAAALALTGLSEPRIYGAHELVRNTVGCVGMVAAAAPLVGAKLAWAPATAYPVVVTIVAPRPLDPDTSWWTWPVQLSAADQAWWAASCWFAVGLVLYAVFGASAGRDRDG